MTDQHPSRSSRQPREEDLKLSYAHKLALGGNCSATTKQDLPCPIHGDRLVDGHWLCHIHDPEGTFQRQLRRAREDHEKTPDVEGQMTFDQLISDEDAGDALFNPPTKAQAHQIVKRIKKWTAPR